METQKGILAQYHTKSIFALAMDNNNPNPIIKGFSWNLYLLVYIICKKKTQLLSCLHLAALLFLFGLFTPEPRLETFNYCTVYVLPDTKNVRRNML